jgi:peroxiredoxin
MGLSVAFISVDEVEGASKTATPYEVPFPLLSDPDAKVLDAYKVTNNLDGAGTERLKSIGIDIERWSKQKHHKIAIPSIFLIGKDKRVKWAHAAEDHKTRPNIDALIAALKEKVAKKP